MVAWSLVKATAVRVSDTASKSRFRQTAGALRNSTWSSVGIVKTIWK